jgi:hypothetical protein
LNFAQQAQLGIPDVLIDDKLGWQQIPGKAESTTRL